MNNHITENLEIILKRIHNACVKAGRNTDEVKLLLATKTVSPENIKIALTGGTTIIGENKVQEIKEKYEALKDVPHEKHFIGHLQTNKIKDILKYGVTCIESVDRIDLVEKLHQRLLLEGKKMKIMVQVNTSGEESKFGIRPEDAPSFIHQISGFETIEIKGLMTIGLFSADSEKVRKCYQILKNVQTTISDMKIEGVEMNELSMGMSGDLEIAIKEGATLVRVGTAIFGKRIYPDSYYWNEGQK